MNATSAVAFFFISFPASFFFFIKFDVLTIIKPMSILTCLSTTSTIACPYKAATTSGASYHLSISIKVSPHTLLVYPPLKIKFRGVVTTVQTITSQKLETQVLKILLKYSFLIK